MTFSLEQLDDDAGAEQALAWLRGITKAIGPCFHPDTPGADYLHGDTDEPLLTEEQARRLDEDLDRAFELLEAAGRDPYAIAGKVQRRLLGMPRPD